MTPLISYAIAVGGILFIVLLHFMTNSVQAAKIRDEAHAREAILHKYPDAHIDRVLLSSDNTHAIATCDGEENPLYLVFVLGLHVNTRQLPNATLSGVTLEKTQEGQLLNLSLNFFDLKHVSISLPAQQHEQGEEWRLLLSQLTEKKAT